ncbi:MAG: transposase family protein [Sulfuricella sp.]
MNRLKLSDEEWERLLAELRKIPGIRIGVPMKCRFFVEAVLWILRTGAQWRWSRIQDELAQGADLQNVCIDSTIARAHACAAGAGKNSADDEALGRSRGGFSCKIHALTDSLGLPIKFILTGGQTADISQALPHGDADVCGLSAVVALNRRQYVNRT